MNEAEIPRLESLAKQFGEALSSPSEQEIHSFLEAHLDLLRFNSWGGFVKSKFRLADQFIPDFLVVGLEPHSNSPSPLVTFVEIERANEPLFTRAGDPTSFLTHAIRQVQDWKRWVTENKPYLQTIFQKLMLEEYPETEAGERGSWSWKALFRGSVHGFYDQYLVIAGRRNSMRIEDRLLLAQMNRDLGGIRIITYDVLLDDIFSYIDGTDRWRDLFG